MMKKRNKRSNNTQPVRHREDKPLGTISNINYEAFVEDDDNDEFLLQTAPPRRSGIKPSGSGRNTKPIGTNKSRRAAQTPEHIAARRSENEVRHRAHERSPYVQAHEISHNAQAPEVSHNMQASEQPRSDARPPEHPRDLQTAEMTRGGQAAETQRKPASGAHSGRKASEAPQERKTVERRRAIAAERICLAVLGTALCAASAYNFFQPNRPTVSESENRTLTPMPTYSAQALRSGEYFSQLALHFSDTFVGRERLMSVSRRIGTLTGPKGGLSVLDAPAMTDESLSPDAEQRLEDLGRRAAKRWSGDKAGYFKRLVEPPEAITVSLSESDITLYVGSTATLDLTVTGAGELSLDCSGDAASAVLDGESVVITAAAEGESTVTVTYGEASCSCTVHVRTAGVSENQGAEADFIGSGMFIYGDAVYTISGYGETAVGYFSQCAQYYASLFPGTRVSVLPCPVSAIVVDDLEVTANFTDQKWVLDTMQSRFSGINFVNSYSEIYSHRKEYLYFKSDHHWTQLGAYYAYRAFAESVGLTPTPLSDMRSEVINDDFQGSMYSFTGDARVKNFRDTVEVHYPTKDATMTVTRRDGTTQTYDRLIIPEYGSYLSFIASDNPFTVINVPSNPQDRSILVLKDSYGNAFVPFLAEHYGNIIVIDPRYCDENIAETYKNYGLTDILFVGNIQSHNSVAWSKYFYKCVGVDMG